MVATLTLMSFAAITAAAETSAELDGPAVGDLQAAARLDPPPARVRAVRIFGDSLFVGISDERYLIGPTLQQSLRDSGVTVSSTVALGLNIGTGRAAIRADPASIVAADTLIVGLGTNDIFNSGGLAPTSWRASIDALVADARAINPDIRLIWVDVAFERYATRATVFNQQLNAVAATDDGFSVCPWNALISSHPEWLGGDRLHLSGRGYTERRNLILSCVGPR
jgi:lysophospholipase L1-like esterase